MKKTLKKFLTLHDRDETTDAHAPEAGLSQDEYERARRLLMRAPNKVELGIIGAMWSEHCSYKSSRAHLAKIPSKSPRVLVGPGENAGVVDIGCDRAVVFKIESHNHPSFIEPFQGAATGVGGILRDIFTMGATPFATAVMLRFGEPSHKKVNKLLHGVVSGIASYGNCFGVPTVMADVDFHKSYNGNNLVNAFAIGVVDKNAIFLGKASGEKNRVLYVGAKTGRDGIMGAVMASDIFADDTENARPTVQVGDPFTEKLLHDACMEVFANHLVVGVQDMGAAGLTCSLFEMAHRASAGLMITLDDVPTRDSSMTAYDIMLSESQERMLFVAESNNVERIKNIFDKYELDCIDIGYVTGDGLVRINHRGVHVVNVSATLIVENAPRYRREFVQRKTPHTSSIKNEVTLTIDAVMENYAHDIGLKDVGFITEQFDTHIGLNTVVGPGESDACVMRVPKTSKSVAISLIANARQTALDPFIGGERHVMEAMLAISTQGAIPIGITNCLNFGSPENPHVMNDLKSVIEGMSSAARALEIPIVSGNVSLYNETNGDGILPTLALAMVGLVDNAHNVTRFRHAREGDCVVIAGEIVEDFSGAENVLPKIFEEYATYPWDYGSISTMTTRIVHGVNAGLITSACVVGRGGMLHSLTKIMAESKQGMTISFGSARGVEIALALTSEQTPRVIMCMSEEKLKQFSDYCASTLPLTIIGRIGGDKFAIHHEGMSIYACDRDSHVRRYRDLGAMFAHN